RAAVEDLPGGVVERTPGGGQRLLALQHLAVTGALHRIQLAQDVAARFQRPAQFLEGHIVAARGAVGVAGDTQRGHLQAAGIGGGLRDCSGELLSQEEVGDEDAERDDQQEQPEVEPPRTRTRRPCGTSHLDCPPETLSCAAHAAASRNVCALSNEGSEITGQYCSPAASLNAKRTKDRSCASTTPSASTAAPSSKARWPTTESTSRPVAAAPRWRTTRTRLRSTRSVGRPYRNWPRSITVSSVPRRLAMPSSQGLAPGTKVSTGGTRISAISLIAETTSTPLTE